ncbi:MAG: hypothetical protein IJ848_03520 [Alphaproteobacteria bacterium]|nr:hypothetical protein [Alphaproteobacteria bacterium]
MKVKIMLKHYIFMLIPVILFGSNTYCMEEKKCTEQKKLVSYEGNNFQLKSNYFNTENNHNSNYQNYYNCIDKNFEIKQQVTFQKRCINNLNQQLESQNNYIINLNQEMSRLKVQASNQSFRIQGLENDNCNLYTINEAQKQQLLLKEKELNNKTNKISELEQTISIKTNKLQENNKLIEELRTNKNHLNSELQDKTNEINKTKSEINTMRTTINILNEENNKLKNENDTLNNNQSKLSQYQNQITGQNKTIQKLYRNLETQDSRIKELNSKNEQLINLSRLQDSSTKTMKEQNETMTEQIIKQGNTIKIILDKLRSKQKQINEKNRTIYDLKKSADLKDKTITEQNKEISKYEQRILELEKQLKEMPKQTNSFNNLKIENVFPFQKNTQKEGNILLRDKEDNKQNKIENNIEERKDLSDDNNTIENKIEDNKGLSYNNNKNDSKIENDTKLVNQNTIIIEKEDVKEISNNNNETEINNEQNNNTIKSNKKKKKKHKKNKIHKGETSTDDTNLLLDQAIIDNTKQNIINKLKSFYFDNAILEINYSNNAYQEINNKAEKYIESTYDEMCDFFKSSDDRNFDAIDQLTYRNFILFLIGTVMEIQKYNDTVKTYNKKITNTKLQKSLLTFCGTQNTIISLSDENKKLINDSIYYTINFYDKCNNPILENNIFAYNNTEIGNEIIQELSNDMKILTKKYLETDKNDYLEILANARKVIYKKNEIYKLYYSLFIVDILAYHYSISINEKNGKTVNPEYMNIIKILCKQFLSMIDVIKQNTNVQQMETKINNIFEDSIKQFMPYIAYWHVLNEISNQYSKIIAGKVDQYTSKIMNREFTSNITQEYITNDIKTFLTEYCNI